MKEKKKIFKFKLINVYISNEFCLLSNSHIGLKIQAGPNEQNCIFGAV